MATEFVILTKEGIASAKEKWIIDEGAALEEQRGVNLLVAEPDVEQRIRREAMEYARKLAELNETREAAIRAHVHALRLQALMQQRRVKETERSKANVKDVDPELEAEFKVLSDQWRRETRMLSSDSDIAASFAYHQIIGMGEKALPLIFREMQERGGRWFWALRAITRQNPVRPEDRGNVRSMTQAWLEWGRQHNYV